MNDAILILNAGSSSIKFAIFDATFDAEKNTNLERLYAGSVTDIGGEQSEFVASDARGFHGDQPGMVRLRKKVKDHAQALQIIIDWLKQETAHLHFVAAGHRVVHGGSVFSQPVCVDKAVLAQLEALIPLAPLHQPYALYALEILLEQQPEIVQVACFDTAFHSTMPEREQYFALPERLFTEGIRRYGFHGLSYEYIVSVLPEYLGEKENSKIVIAHLGHGVSMCAVNDGKSVATSMSFTPLDGLPMGTRSGAIDPAVVFYLLAQGKTADDIAYMLNHQSGLLGLSGISGDMQTLLASSNTKATWTVGYFCYRISRELASLAAALGGLDALVFTGGIGEQAAKVRDKICRLSGWLGIELDTEANLENTSRISTKDSRISVWVIPTDEELVIARHTQKLLNSQSGVTTDC